MSPNPKSVKRVAAAVRSEGALSRLLEFPDGSGRIETWSVKKGAWEPGGAAPHEFVGAVIRPSADWMRSLGVPEADVRELDSVHRRPPSKG